MNEFYQWIISGLLSLLGLTGGFILWYVASIFKKTEGLDEQIRRNNAKITTLREHFNENISKVFTAQQGVGDELLKVRRAVVSSTVVLRRRKTEIDKIVEDGKWTQDRVEQTNAELDRHKKVLIKHESELIKLKGGNILVKGKKDG